MASKQSEELKTLYRGWVAAMQAEPDMPIEELRRRFEHLGDVTGEPGGVDYIESDAGGVPCMWAIPKGCDQTRVLLCAHGGGYVICSMYTHRKMYAHVANAIGCRALIVDYRRAPENIHPGPVDDIVTSYRWLLDQGIEPRHVALIGDSAGGGLAVTTILRAREKGLPLPAATMPLSPWLDMDAKGETFETNKERDLLVSRDVIAVMSGMFLGEGGHRDDPLANPLHGDLRGFPPIYIQVGADETLLADSRNLAELARRSDVNVTLEIVPEMQHIFQVLAGAAPEADAAIAKLAQWVRPHLGLGG
jgi:epsilon-lactone hydrolase